MTEELDREQFWKDRRERYDGEIRYKTFARLYGRSGDTLTDLPGILYQVDDTLVFEDFEKKHLVLDLFKRKNREEYEKTEFQIDLKEIEAIRDVSKRDMVDAINDRINPAHIHSISTLVKFFAGSVTQIHVKNGTSYFFELVNDKEFYSRFRSSVEE